LPPTPANTNFPPNPEGTRCEEIRLLSNNPEKVRQLEESGIEVVERVPCQPRVSKFLAIPQNKKSKWAFAQGHIRALDVPAARTARLILKPLELADALQSKLFSSLGNRPIPQQQSPWPIHLTARNTIAANSRFRHGTRRAWHWTIRLKAAPETMIGSTSLFKSPTKIAASGSAQNGKAKAS